MTHSRYYYKPGELDKFMAIMNSPNAQDPKRPASVLGSIIPFFMFSIAGGLIFALLFLPLLTPALPAPRVAQEYWDSLPSDLPDVPLPQKSYILDANGKQIAEFFSENRILTSLDEVSPHVIDALLATEDSRFYEHNGVDWMGIGRALRSNFQKGAVQQGASTITQQLVKNTLILAATTQEERDAATEISFQRKMDEVHLATEVEKQMTKDEILERYLNVVLFSNGVYGIGTAADYYFDKPASDLSLAESALLVGLLKNPSAYDPIDNPKNAVARRSVVLKRMVEVGSITESQAAAAGSEALELRLKPSTNGCKASKYPFYCQWVMNNLRSDKRLGETKADRESRLYLGGLTIHTPLDVKMQKKAQKVIDDALGRDNRVAGATAIVEPGTGRVLAMAQNRSWGDGKSSKGNIRTQVILPDSGFQPGSAFKPVTLAAALESGMPADAVLTAPEVYKPDHMLTPERGIQNSGRGQSGPLDVVKATAISSNTWYAVLQERVGVLNVAQMARALGLAVPDTVGAKDASFTLGVTDASPLEMAAMYASFAAKGVYCAPTGIDKITDAQGRTLEPVTNNCHQVMSPSTAATVTKALEAVIDSEYEGRTGKLADIGRPAGGKTGTTTSHSAAWFVGMTPHLSSAVWLGDPRGGFKYPLTGGVRFNGQTVYNVYASNIAAPLWRDLMTAVSEPYPKTKFDTRASGAPAGSTAVPDVRGMTLENAVGVLHAHGFTVEIEGTSSPTPGVLAGVVTGQTPFGGQRIFSPVGAKVSLLVSAGTKIPDSIADAP